MKCIQGILSVSAKSWQPVGVSVVADHVHALDYHFAESFAGAHDVGRVYGLVGTDQHKSLTAVHHCRIRSLIGSYHIVLDRLTGAVLHQRHVLMCGCMIYDRSALLGLILEIGGYVGTAAVQTESALTSIKICFVWIPIAVYVCGLVIMKFYHLDKEFAGIIEDLKKRTQK